MATCESQSTHLFGSSYYANRAKLRVKIKSLAAEATIIRKEEKKYDGQSPERATLRLHRIVDVREESRAAQLAYAYLRCKPYKSIEQKAGRPIPVKRLESLIRKYGSHTAIEGFAKWLE